MDLLELFFTFHPDPKKHDNAEIGCSRSYVDFGEAIANPGLLLDQVMRSCPSSRSVSAYFLDSESCERPLKKELVSDALTRLKTSQKQGNVSMQIVFRDSNPETPASHCPNTEKKKNDSIRSSNAQDKLLEQMNIARKLRRTGTNPSSFFSSAVKGGSSIKTVSTTASTDTPSPVRCRAPIFRTFSQQGARLAQLTSPPGMPWKDDSCVDRLLLVSVSRKNLLDPCVKGELDLNEAQNNPSLLYNMVLTLAQRIFESPQAELQITYRDEDGDDCSLTCATAHDAIKHTALTEHGTDQIIYFEACLKATPATIISTAPKLDDTYDIRYIVLLVTGQFENTHNSEKVRFEYGVSEEPDAGTIVRTANSIGSKILQVPCKDVEITYDDDAGDKCALMPSTAFDALELCPWVGDTKTLRVEANNRRMTHVFRRLRRTSLILPSLSLMSPRSSKMSIVPSIMSPSMMSNASFNPSLDEEINHSYKDAAEVRRRSVYLDPAMFQEREQTATESRKQNAELKEKVAVMESNNASYHRVVEAERAASAKKIEDLMQSLSHVEDDTHKLTVRLSEAEASVRLLTKKCSAAEEKLRAESEDHAEALAALQRQCEITEEALAAELNTAVQKTTEVTIAGENARASASQEQQGSQDLINRLQKELEDSHLETKRFRREKATAERDALCFQEALSIAEQMKHNADDEISQLSKEVLDAHTAMDHLLMQKRSIEEGNAGLQRALRRAADDASSYKLAASGTRRELDNKIRECVELSAALRSARLDFSDARRRAIVPCDPSLSAMVVACDPDLFGVELISDNSGSAASGDVTQQFPDALDKFGGRQVFRIDRVIVNVAQEHIPATYAVVLQNTGEVDWPETAVLVHSSGCSFDLPTLELGPVAPGCSAELQMEFQIPTRLEPDSVVSIWVPRDVATGIPLGPLLIFECSWVF